MPEQAAELVDRALALFDGPAGIGVALVALLVVLFVLRKILSLLFFVVALALAGWGAARSFGWDIPFVLPGQLSEAAREALEASRRSLGGDAVVGAEALTATGRRAGGAAVAPETAAAQAVAEDVRTASFAYNAPDSMLLNMPVDLRLAIDPSGMGDAASALEGLPGEVRGGEAELTRQVTASLYGSGFDVRPLKPERQVLTDATATWQWEVTPRQTGAHTLILEVFAHPGGGDAAAPVQQLREEIQVKVSVVSRVLGFAQTTQPMMAFAAAAVSLLLAGLGMIRRPMRRVAPW